jgi:hypothetical protein
MFSALLKLNFLFHSSTNTNASDDIRIEKKKRTDRKYISFFFCTNDACVESFQSEDDLINHHLIGQHTTKDSQLTSNDAAKILLFDK